MTIPISEYDYDLPEERIAKFPLARRDDSKLLIYRDGNISERTFNHIGEVLPVDSLVVFNNTRVVRARLFMHRKTGGRVEIFCLEPAVPADYERAFAVRRECEWHCIVGSGKRWKNDAVTIEFDNYTLKAYRKEGDIVRFEWNAPLTFGELLELLGNTPIPPYLRRESEDIDTERYQTVYAQMEGSVAAPTAGLHFTDELIARLKKEGVEFESVTLHVGAGTFLPVKGEDAALHEMHTEHFEVRLEGLKKILTHKENLTAVGTTTMRTLESLPVLGWRIRQTGNPETERPVGQWEAYDIPDSEEGLLEELLQYMERNKMVAFQASTQIMIKPGFKFRVVRILITNFHQPKSTLLLLVSAFIGEARRAVYDYALSHDFRFLSYGDSSILFWK